MSQTLPATFQPLEPLKGELIFLPDMTNPNCGTGPRNGHEAYGTIFWGGPPVGPKFSEPGGKTLDQVIVDGLGAGRTAAAPASPSRCRSIASPASAPPARAAASGAGPVSRSTPR